MSSRLIHLIDKHNKKIPIGSSFTFGRVTKGFNDINSRISRKHFEIKPLPFDDPQSNTFCAQLTLKGHYLRITSESDPNSKEFTTKGVKILLKHNDKLDLVNVHSDNISDPYSLTIHDSMAINTRKRKRSLIASISDNDSLYGSPAKKRARYDTNNDDSICYDYNNNNNNNNNFSLSPSNICNNSNNHNNLSPALSLSGLMASNFDRSPSRNSNSSRSVSPSKYSRLASFPSDPDNNENVTEKSRRKSNDNLSDKSDDNYLQTLLAETEDLKKEEEEKQCEIENIQISPKDKPANELRLKEQKEKQILFNDGRYSLALPIIDCHRYKFEIKRTLNVIASALKQFMSIHRHPKLRIVVIATNEFRNTFYKALKKEYDANDASLDSSGKSMSLDLEFAQDTMMKYELFEYDERIIIYSGAWEDIVRLKDNAICSQYIANFTFWNFSGQKGDKLNKLINKKCDSLSDLSIHKYKTAKKKCQCYAVRINEENGGDLYALQNVRCVIQTRPPSLNPKSHDFVKHKEKAYRDLYDTYYRIMEGFYAFTQLTKPLNDSFIAKDIANWKSKPSVKKENMSLDDNCEEMQMDDDEALHFSLKPVPVYNIPNVRDWPKCEGYWKNALNVYTNKERDARYDKCIFYEDDRFVIIYDRYWKAKIHLLIIPKMKLKTVYDLDPRNNEHIEMIEGIIARAQWIKNGIQKRNVDIQKIKYGFHAIPSMNQIHCHLISDEMDSVNMKQKKHFHSFTSNYFVPAKVMLKVLKIEERPFKIKSNYYKNLLKEKLKCHFCFNDKIKTMPALKKHLKQCQFRMKKRTEIETNDFEIVFDD